MFKFEKAERRKAKLRLALSGPSGSGKTFSALLIAKGIGGRVAVIDTEHGSASLYAENPKIGLDFDVLELGAPYSPQRYVEAIKAAVGAKYDIVLVDSGSHAWMGEGGLLEMVDMAAKANRNNSMAGWKAVAPHEKKFLDAITSLPIHIIMTLRTKTDWDMSKDPKTGKVVPVKVGLKPEQRQGLEYEFTTVLDLSVDGNVATASKDRTDLFKGQHFVPSEETGKALLAWLEQGQDSAAQTQTPNSGSSLPASQDRPDRGEMITHGWERLKIMTAQKKDGKEPGQRLSEACLKLEAELQASLGSGPNPLAALNNDMLREAWKVIEKWYLPWKEKDKREAA